MGIALTLDAEEVSARLASAAYHRALGRRLAHEAQKKMSPEDAAADEFDREEASYQSLGAIELFSVDDPRRVPSAVIRASTERAEYIRRRAEEIRKERDARQTAADELLRDRPTLTELMELGSFHAMFKAAAPQGPTDAPSSPPATDATSSDEPQKK